MLGSIQGASPGFRLEVLSEKNSLHLSIYPKIPYLLGVLRFKSNAETWRARDLIVHEIDGLRFLDHVESYAIELVLAIRIMIKD